MEITFYDTSALLAAPNIEQLLCELTSPTLAYISHFVLGEIESIKNSASKSDEIKAKARRVARCMLQYPGSFLCENISVRDIEKIKRKYSFLPQNNDGDILAEALYLSKKYDVTLVTADVNMALFARSMGITTYQFKDTEIATEPWAGWAKYYPNEKEMASLYSDPKMNILEAPINQYCEIFQDKELKDVLRWDGTQYQRLKYKEMKNPYTQEIIRPRNLEQKMAFDLLQNPDIKVKTLFSSWGSGKTLLALTYALGKIYNGEYKKLLFVRNNIIAANTFDTGYLPGDLKDKMTIWNRNIADHVGGDLMMEQLEDNGVIETFPLSHMRGRSIHDIVLVDECENLTDKHITLLLSRIEEDGEIIFCGDSAQCDFRNGVSSGMDKMINALKGEKLFGAVKLIKSERGGVPLLCDKIIPPR